MRTALLACVLLGLSFPAHGQWPQYLGPTGDSVSHETGLLESWPEGGPPEVWRGEMGPGFGGAAIVDGEVFLLDRVQGEADVLRVLDLESGKQKWSYRYDAPGRVGFEGSRCTPAVTDTHIYTTGEFGHLYAFDREAQKVAWSVNLFEKYPDADNSDNQNWGYGMNPLVVDDLVIASSPFTETPGLIAFDPKTGEVKWESDNFGGSSMYSSPLVRTVAGQRGIVIRNIKSLFFIDIKTGQTLFEYQCYDSGKIPITPITVMPGGDRVFVTQGYGMGSVMLQVTRDDDGAFQIKELYRTIEGSQIHPAIPIGDYLYINHTENDTSKGAKRQYAGLACVKPETGEVVWNTGEQPFIGRGATLFVQGKLIMQDAEGGMLYLVDPSPEGFKPISSFRATHAKGKKAWAPLALGDGRLIVRDQDEIVCFDLRKK